MLFFAAFSLALAGSGLSLPIGYPLRRASTTPVSPTTLDTYHYSALLAQAAYCDDPSAALSQLKLILQGGDGGATPRYYVGHDPTTNSIVVAHEGTVKTDIDSILVDAEANKVDIDTTFFPGASSDIEVHDGFSKAFARTANDILGAVKQGMVDNNISKVSVTGHSLGAALGVMTSVFLQQQLKTTASVSTVVFGLPRSGNQEWADFVDANLPTLAHVNNRHDIVPTIPPKLLGYRQPSGEIFIQPDATSTVVACPGQENEDCSDGNSIFSASISDHLGPYIGEMMGVAACPVKTRR